jgi:F0F1-type ATP synthase membrane subunit b/b'
VNYAEIAKWSDIISALLFVGVLVWLWLRFLQPAVLAAQEQSNNHIAQTERHRDEAKAALRALQSEIEGAEHDAQLIRDRALAQASHERAAILAEAKIAGERALRSAEGELDRARAAARERFREELAASALALARHNAQTQINDTVNSRLVQAFAESLEHGGKN